MNYYGITTLTRVKFIPIIKINEETAMIDTEY